MRKKNIKETKDIKCEDKTPKINLKKLKFPKINLKKLKFPKINLKKLKFGSVSAITTALVISVVVIFNIIASMFMKRYPIKLDFTPDNRYAISNETISVLNNMNKNVKITVTSTKDYFIKLSEYYKNLYYQQSGIVLDVPFSIIPEILEKYSIYAEQGNGNITIEYVDINKNPEVITKLKENYSGEITDGCIVFTCGKRTDVISTSDIANMIVPSHNSTTGIIDIKFVGESKLTGTIKSITDMNPIRTAIITSLNGNSIITKDHFAIVSSFKKFLSANGYYCTEIDASDRIETEIYDLIILAGSSVDFPQDIVAKFSDFLYNNGEYNKNMIYIPNTYVANLTNIDDFLAEWKIKIDNTMIYDEDKSVQISPGVMAPILNFAANTEEGICKLDNAALPIAAPFGRSISILSVNGTGVITELLKTSPSSYAVDIFNEETPNVIGEYNIVVKSRKEINTDVDIVSSNLLVIGSAFMLNSLFIDKINTFNNANAILNIINDITGKEKGIIIADKSIQQATLKITATASRVISIIVIIILPILIAITGITVLMWRNNK